MSDHRTGLALTLLEAAPDGLVAAAGDGSILFWNRGAERLLGFPREEAVGRSLQDLLGAGDPEVGRSLRAAAGARVVRGRRKDGTEIPLEIRWSALETEDGLLTVGTMRDAGDGRRRTPAAEGTRAPAPAAGEEGARVDRLAELGQLAARVSHELRNPLGVINNSVYYLRTVLPDDARYRRHLEILEREVAAASRIVSGLLDFARTRPPVPAPTDLDALVREALERRPLPDGVRLVLDVAGPPPSVAVDRDQLATAVANLVGNALEAMPDGGILTVRTAEAEGDAVLSVADTGAGIAPEHLDRIFEPLFTTKPRGIGLGLAVARSLVEANGARLSVDSAPGRGSRFEVRFPAAAKGGPPR